MTSILSRCSRLVGTTPPLPLNSSPFLNHLRRLVSSPRFLRASMEDASSQSTDGLVVRFPLSSTSSLVIQRGDITKWFVDGSTDAIVNPADERMLGGGGADGAIHSAAGPDLLLACYGVPEVSPGVRCPTGEARITPGFKLPVAHVVFTVGPIYDGNSTAEASLRSAYRNSLKVAKENNIQYIAFPAVSCGVFGYPYDEAATIAISTIKEFADDIKEVNPANERMLGGGGADGAIHRAAGPDLLQACYGVPEVSRGVRCPTGEARITPGFKLPVAHVVFTVGPIYNGNSTAEASLRSAYRNSLKVAKENNIQYIAFPAISCGVYGYPYDEAATVAISTIKEFANDIKEVHFLHFLEEVYDVWVNKANELLQA